MTAHASPAAAKPAPVALSLAQARCLQLHAQGLLHPPRRAARRADLAAAIERMRMLQIDTIHVVARSPYLVLHARLGDYPPSWLDEALAQGELAECWAHEACFVPAADYPWHDALRHARGHHWAHRHAQRMLREHRPAMEALLARVAAQGPVRAADFPAPAGGQGAGWWSWKPEKRWLEAWFALGKLMVSHRERFQRVYDLPARVRARWRADPRPVPDDPVRLRQRFIADAVRALGITPARWVADYHRLRPAVSDTELAPLLDRGELLRAQVRGWEAPAYVHRDHADALARASRGRLRATHTTLLSPFDPLVWDRSRALGMFDFDYVLECYTPAPRRRHGYFVLPILHRGRLVGRLDAKAHRLRGEFEVKAIHLEPDVAPDAPLCAALAAALRRSACWHGTPRVRVVRSHPAALAAPLRTALRALD